MSLHLFTSFIILTVGFCLAVPIIEEGQEALKELERSIKEENVFKQFTLDILGHDGKKHPNKFNIVSGASETAVYFMYQLYHNVVTGQQSSRNSTDIEARLLSDEPDADEDEEDSDRDNRVKRNIETRRADTAISFITQGLSARPNATDSDNAFYFDLRTDYDTSISMFSELRINYDKNQNKHGAVAMSLYRINKIKKTGQEVEDKNVQLLNEKMLEGKQDTGWIVFNTTETVAAWKYTPEENHGFLLKIKTKHGKELTLKEVGITGSTGDTKKRPFLVSFFQSANKLLSDVIEELNSTAIHKKRSRRSLNFRNLINSDQTKKFLKDSKFNMQTEQSFCARSNLYVTFEALKWDKWVIAPEGFPAGMCTGTCSYPLHKHANATNHAIIQSLQNVITGGKFPNPCCAPHHMSPLTMFLFDSYGNPVLKKYTNMVVDSCGCF